MTRDEHAEAARLLRQLDHLAETRDLTSGYPVSVTLRVSGGTKDRHIDLTTIEATELINSRIDDFKGRLKRLGVDFD